jgi:hypothetical protein
MQSWFKVKWYTKLLVGFKGLIPMSIILYCIKKQLSTFCATLWRADWLIIARLVSKFPPFQTKNPKFHCHVQQSVPPVHTLTRYYYHIHFNISPIYPCTPTSSKWAHPFRFPTKILYEVSTSHFTMLATCPTHLILLDVNHPGKIRVKVVNNEAHRRVVFFVLLLLCLFLLPCTVHGTCSLYSRAHSCGRPKGRESMSDETLLSASPCLCGPAWSVADCCEWDKVADNSVSYTKLLSVLPWDSSIIIFYTFLIFPIRAECSDHPFLLDWISLVI